MADREDRWNATLGRMRDLLLRLSPRSAADRRAVAELLECFGAINEIYRTTAEQGNQAPVPAPVSEPGHRRRRTTDPAHRYVVEQTPRGNFLAEYRGPDKQPFRVPEDAYNAAARAMAEMHEPAPFEVILRRFRERADENLADYLLRICLRLWVSRNPPLVRHGRRRYSPVGHSTFAKQARRIWSQLGAKNARGDG
jgi:hypothetical protein